LTTAQAITHCKIVSVDADKVKGFARQFPLPMQAMRKVLGLGFGFQNFVS